jgi:cell division protease FtsH
MVTQYGMSDKFGMMTLESSQNQYLDGRNVFTGSEESNAEVDQEVVKILGNCHQKALGLLKGKRDKLTEIATYLYDKETITGETFMKLLKGEEQAAGAAA